MNHNIVVLFTDNNARILRNPINLDYLKTLDNVLINPDLSKVAGIPPHFWVKEGDSVRAMTTLEKVERAEHHEVNGVANEIHKKSEPEQIIIEKIVERIIPQEFQKNKIYQALLFGAVMGASLVMAFEAIFRR